jgi:hypothetical protein
MWVGFREQRRRMGRWKERVERVTRTRKKRYCTISGWVWRMVLVGDCGFETGFPEGLLELLGREACGVSGAGRLSFSMRAQVR